MLSKAELARRAGLSALTIDRVEAGRPCRLDTKRRILTALGLEVDDHQAVFGRSLDSFPASHSTDMGGAEAFVSSPSRDGAETRDPRRSQ